MASEIGKIVHCKICGAPIEARGNRLYCPVCYNQNRRNAAQRSNARTKMEREQTKREEAKMKENNRIATSAAELNMRAKLSNLGGISYGDLSIWEQTHGMEFSAWVHEWEKLNSGTQLMVEVPGPSSGRIPDPPEAARASLDEIHFL